jgi:hypothetical protein
VAIDTAGAAAMAAGAAATAIMVVADDTMAAVGKGEEVTVDIGAAAEATQDMARTEGAAAMATAADTAAVAAATSRHTIFKARWLSIF